MRRTLSASQNSATWAAALCLRLALLTLLPAAAGALCSDKSAAAPLGLFPLQKTNLLSSKRRSAAGAARRSVAAAGARWCAGAGPWHTAARPFAGAGLGPTEAGPPFAGAGRSFGGVRRAIGGQRAERLPLAPRSASPLQRPLRLGQADRPHRVIAGIIPTRVAGKVFGMCAGRVQLPTRTI
jgi:hypothetical protein